MPEGPECHAIASRLGSWLKGARVQEVHIQAGRYAKKRPPGFCSLLSRLEEGDLAVERVGAKGKLVYIVLGRGEVVLLSTMGLSGTWTKNRTKHCDIRVRTDKGDVWFKDQLHYGTLAVTDQKGLDRKLARLGPDVTLGNSLTESFWESFSIKHGTTSVAEALMKQEWLSGVGNYLKAEILLAAGIAPLSQLDDLPRTKRMDLLMALNQIPRKYLDARTGRGPRIKMKVYGRKVGPGGHRVVRTKTPDARITHWVPELQREYTAH